MRAADTTPDAAALHEQVYRAAGPIRRFKMALELSDLTHTFAVAGMRQRHPEYTADEATTALAQALYGNCIVR